MGSVTVFFIVPAMLIMMLFGSIAGVVTGDNVTKVELPYNPSEGIVWEYDDVDDPLFDLVKTEINGNEQVFTFKGISMFDAMKEDIDSDILMDAVFTNENGEKLVYYVRHDYNYFAINYKMKFWSPDEYVVFDYTPKEETTVDGAEWVSSGYKIAESENDGEKTFTYLLLPDDENGSIFKVSCMYRTVMNDGSGRYTPYEKMELEIRVSGNEYEIKKEKRYYHDGNTWLSYNPAMKEG
ncbi:MAG: hypothetical protein IJE48_06740 [Clostridia bacterium]|nr:hypothetical protein [Clostridia bacterium]